MLRQIKTRYLAVIFTVLLVLFSAYAPIAVSRASAAPLTLVSATSKPTCKNATQISADGSTCQVTGSCTGEVLSADLSSPNGCALVFYLLVIIDVLSGLVGITVTIMIIVGGIQYSAAGDDPQKVTEAKKKITNALLALLVFIFMFAFLQWVVPGGLF